MDPDFCIHGRHQELIVLIEHLPGSVVKELEKKVSQTALYKMQTYDITSSEFGELPKKISALKIIPLSPTTREYDICAFLDDMKPIKKVPTQ